MKFSEQCVMWTKNHVLEKKKVYKWVKHKFINKSLNQKVDVEEKYFFSSEEKVQGSAVSKEDHTDSFLGHERIHHN